MLLYNAGISFYRAAVNILSPFNKKAKLMLSGRKESKKKLESFSAERKPGDKVILIHAASLGEFEQARPLIEKLSRKYPSGPCQLLPTAT